MFKITNKKSKLYYNNDNIKLGIINNFLNTISKITSNFIADKSGNDAFLTTYENMNVNNKSVSSIIYENVSEKMCQVLEENESNIDQQNVFDLNISNVDNANLNLNITNSAKIYNTTKFDIQLISTTLKEIAQDMLDQSVNNLKSLKSEDVNKINKTTKKTSIVTQLLGEYDDEKQELSSVLSNKEISDFISNEKEKIIENKSFDKLVTDIHNRFILNIKQNINSKINLNNIKNLILKVDSSVIVDQVKSVLIQSDTITKFQDILNEKSFFKFDLLKDNRTEEKKNIFIESKKTDEYLTEMLIPLSIISICALGVFVIFKLLKNKNIV